MKPSRLPRGPQRREKKQRARERYEDGMGVAFGDVRGLWLPEDCSDWPRLRPINIDVDAKEVSRRMHGLFSIYYEARRDSSCFGTCWLCRQARQLEAHHIVPRSDLLTNLAMLCGRWYEDSCHVRVQDNPAALREVLVAKWKFDRVNLSWVHLNRIYGKWLPDLDV